MTATDTSKLTSATELLNDSNVAYLLSYVLENNIVRVLRSDKERDKNFAAIIAQFALDLKNTGLDKSSADLCIKAVVHEAVNMVYAKEEEKNEC